MLKFPRRSRFLLSFIVIATASIIFVAVVASARNYFLDFPRESDVSQKSSFSDIELLNYYPAQQRVEGSVPMPVGTPCFDPARLDPTFDGDGRVRGQFNLGSQGNAIAIQADGKIVVAGTTTTNTGGDDFFVARYNSNGTLDTAFGTGGIAATPFNGHDQAVGLTLQNDGKILVLGYTNAPSTPDDHDIAIARYNPTGSLDTTFDVDGKVITSFGSHWEFPGSIVVQNDGKIVIAGAANIGSQRNFILGRYNPNGSLDTQFDVDGKVNTSFEFGGGASSVAIQADGKIIASGYATAQGGNKTAIVRYNGNGSLDSTFDNDGIVLTTIGATSISYKVKVQPDGKIVSVGYSSSVANQSVTSFAIARYTTNGSLDSSFDTDGVVLTSFSDRVNEARDLAFQSDGKIVVTGLSLFVTTSSDWDMATARYSANGSLDETFDEDGMVTTSVNPSPTETDNDYGLSVGIQTDGKIVVGGGLGIIGLVRYGSPCPPRFTISGQITAGANGLAGVNVALSGASSANAVTDANGNYSFPDLLSGGDFAVTPTRAGYQFTPATRTLTNLQANQTASFSAVAIHTISGQVTLNGSGLSGVNIALSGGATNSATTDVNGNYSFSSLTSGGTYTVTPTLVGYTFTPPNSTFTNLSANQTANFTAAAVPTPTPTPVPVAGGLDTTFNAGVQNPNFLGFLGDGRVQSIVIQPDGKHIIAGNFDTANSTGRTNIARFHADGTLDESFGPGVGFPGGVALDIALQPDGKIIVGGDFNSFTNAEGVFPKFGILRLNSDGSLDNTFNLGQGVQNGPMASGKVRTVIRQPDGKILIGGQFATVDGFARANIARLNDDGSLDNLFAAGTGANGVVNGIALQSDGKVVIGGEMTSYNGTVVNRLFRVDAGGVLDPLFNIGTGPDAPVTALKLQSDGKVLVGGSFGQFNAQTAKWIVRLNTNGSRDTFLEGTVCNSLCTLTNPPQQFSVLANGQIYVSMQGTVNANSTAWGGTLLRYNADGGRDTLFNPPYQTVFSSLPSVNRHAVQTDGSIIGTHGRYLIFPLVDGGPFSNIRRVTPAGTVDTNYKPMLGDAGGNASRSFVSDIALQADGKILAGGNFSMANNELRYDVARFHANGSLDTSFTYPLGGQTIFKILPLPDGKTIVGGEVEVGASGRIGIARLNINGSVDNTFVGPGTGGGGVLGATLQGDGKIIIVGRFSTYNGVARSGIARLHPDGALDTMFNVGTGLTVSGGGHEVYDVRIMPDGKIVVVGYFTAYNGTARQGVVRLQANGALDDTFNPNGQGFVSFKAVEQLPNGQLLVGGDSVFRLNSIGTRDMTFLAPALTSGGVSEIRLLSNGKILIAGNVATGVAPRRSGVIRLQSDGSLDLSFGNGLRGADYGDINGFVGIAVDEANNHIYYGGNLFAYNNVGRGSIARIFLNSIVTTVPVTVNTSPAGRSFTVDGTTYTSPQTFDWDSGTSHTIATTSPQAGSAGTQYVWANWSDGGAISHTVSPTAATTYTANFTTQHQLTMTAGSGGTVSPASAFYNAGSSVPISAAPNSGFAFTGWTGTGSGSYSGTNNPASVTMNGPVTQAAAFGVGSTLQFSSPTYSVTEAGPSATVTVTRSTSATGAISVGYATSNGTATAGSDYTATSGTLNWADGDSASKTFTVPISEDAIFEGSENLNLTLANPTGGATIGTQNTAVLTITDNESQPFVSIARTSGGAEPAVANLFTVTLSGRSAFAVGVHYATANGTASAGTDYSATSGDLTFAALTTTLTQTITVPTLDDAAVEGTEDFLITLSLPTNTTIIGTNPTNGTIADNDVPVARGVFDFDGDRKTDLSIFRPNGTSGSEWWWLKSSTGGNAALQFGSAADKIAPVDFTGDGKTDVAFWRPSTGQWFVMRSEDFSYYAFDFGAVGDVPVPADYDGDGKADAAVFRESELTWYISRSTGGTDIVGFGAAGDKPVNADFDGDGKADIAIFRPNGPFGAEWWVRRSTNGIVFALQFGSATDKAVPGDYTGDGKADIAFWTPASGYWFVLRSEDFSYYAFGFGANGDVASPGDYDGDGKLDAAVFRPGDSTWYVSRSTGGSLIQQFGIPGDVPVPNAFVR